MDIEYNWLAALTAVGLVITTVTVGKILLFRLPALRNTRELDKEQNKLKWKNHGKKYHHRVKSSQMIGLGVTLGFYALVLPFVVTVDAQPWYRILLDSVLILMMYDFFYYLIHRFLFHGKGYFRRVHAVHHQARSRVSSIDSYLLHPAEIVIGQALYYVATPLLCLIYGEPLHVATIVITNVVFTQLNQINHTRIDMEGLPWSIVNWIAMKHNAHHLDMHKGNFATITLLYDWLFGTVETHPRELEKSTSST